MIEWVGQAPASVVDVVDGVQVINKQTAQSVLLMLGQLYPIVTPPEKPPGPTYVKAVTCEEYKQATSKDCTTTAYALVTTVTAGSVVMVNMSDGDYENMQVVILPPELKGAASQFAGPSSDLGVLKIEQAIGVSSKRKKDSVAAAVIGAVAGGALGFAMGGPIGAVAGGGGGIIFANWLVS